MRYPQETWFLIIMMWTFNLKNHACKIIVTLDMFIISSKQIESVEISVLLGFHECFKNLLKKSCWWWSLSCPPGRWSPRLLGIYCNRLPTCRHFSADNFFSVCPRTQAAHVLCTRHVGSLPRNCTLSSIQCVQQSAIAWILHGCVSQYCQVTCVFIEQQNSMIEVGAKQKWMDG